MPHQNLKREPLRIERQAHVKLRGVLILCAASVFLSCLAVFPAHATAPAQGGACTTNYTAAADATGNNLICVSSVWQYPSYTLSSTAAAGGGVCSTAGSLHYNSTLGTIEYCNGSNWVSTGAPSVVSTGTSGQMAYYATTGNTVSGNSKATISTGTLTLGVAGTTAGGLTLEGSSSGAVTIEATSGTYNFILPTTAGTSGQALLSAGGSSAMTFGTLGVPAGGTGDATLTAHGLLVGEGTSAVAVTVAGGTGTVLTGQGSSDPTFGATPTLGTNGGTGGTITLNGSTSGSVIIQTNTAAGTATKFQLPSTNGSNTNVLNTDGTGVTSWGLASTSATVALGSAASTSNPRISGDATTGFYTPSAGHVDIAISSTQTVDFLSNTMNLVPAAGAYQINGINAINYGVDTVAGGSLGIGYHALRGETISSNYYDLAVGYNALSAASLGTTSSQLDVTAIGYGASANMTNALYAPIAIGYNAGTSATTNNCTCMGSEAEANATVQDVAFGYNAAVAGGTGANVTFGANAYTVGTIAYESLMVGAYAGVNAASNTLVFVGYKAGQYASVAPKSIAVGYEALQGNSTPANYITGYYDEAVGSNALQNLQSGAGYNTGLGYNVGSTLVSGSTNFLIGNDTHVADVPTSSTSNFLSIGGLIEGDTNINHVVYNGPAPTSIGTGSSDCGTVPVLVGNDTVGLVTVGTGTNGGVCTVTFKNSWTTAPECFTQNQTHGNLQRNVTTTSTLKLTGTMSASDKLSYFCMGYQL